MNTLIHRTAAGAALALAILPFAAAATAVHAQDMRVKVGDLSHAQEVAAFDRRVDAVADSLCPRDYQAATGRADAEACRQAVHAEVLAKLSDTQRLELASTGPATTQIARVGQ